MRALCMMLRKNISNISEETAFGKQAASNGVYSSSDGNVEDQAHTTGNGELGVKMEEDEVVPASGSHTPRLGSSRILGNGSARAPYELLSDDDDAMSISSDSTINIVAVRSANTMNHVSQASPQTTSTAKAALPSGNGANGYFHGDNIDSAIEEEDEDEEGEITVTSAQKIVDSLWKACHFFSSPRRPRYSNLYGYNTFMLTLVMHLLSMVDTLKLLYRNPTQRSAYQRRRANSVASSAATQETTGSSIANDPRAGQSGRIDRVAMQIDVHDDYDEEYEHDEYEFDEDDIEDQFDKDELEDEFDRDYSLTADAMAALDLGTVLLDMGPYDGHFD
ncbi:hypothetical protein NDA16_000608 [Ustilago loliicola]|nr:hypothetical protein NDA16_000608 [Ustilago loliicola]